MHRFLLRSRSMLSVLSCRVVPVYSLGSPSDLVLVPLPTPSTSTFHGKTPPFLLHITTQSSGVPTFSISVFCSAALISVPLLSNILLDA
jgi:hypothetical protein